MKNKHVGCRGLRGASGHGWNFGFALQHCRRKQDAGLCEKAVRMTRAVLKKALRVGNRRRAKSYVRDGLDELINPKQEKVATLRENASV